MARARLTAFIRALEERHGIRLPDYAALWCFSTDRPAEFWSAVWDFCGVIGQRGERSVADLVRMPGARFFPDARLNFTENVLRRRDGSPALIFNGEGLYRRVVTHAELFADVNRFATALRGAGIRPGDRVAGYMPNVPETMVAALGSAAIGAVWTSCSPDFGVQGVIDRFGQTAPRVLVAPDGYVYAGRTHPLLPRLTDILADLPSVEHVVVAPYLHPEPDISAIPRGVAWADFLGPGSPDVLDFPRFPFNHHYTTWF